MDLLCRKGFYPHEWADRIEKLDYEGIPPIEVFHLQLTNESVLYDDDDDDTTDVEEKKVDKTINDDNHEHCLKVYDVLQCKNVGDYHMTYLHCDVLLLADVFGNFRKTCTEYYELDPSNF